MKQKAGEGDVKDKIDKHLTSLRVKKEMKERVGRNSKNLKRLWKIIYHQIL